MNLRIFFSFCEREICGIYSFVSSLKNHILSIHTYYVKICAFTTSLTFSLESLSQTFKLGVREDKDWTNIRKVNMLIYTRLYRLTVFVPRVIRLIRFINILPRVYTFSHHIIARRAISSQTSILTRRVRDQTVNRRASYPPRMKS